MKQRSKIRGISTSDIGGRVSPSRVEKGAVLCSVGWSEHPWLPPTRDASCTLLSRGAVTTHVLRHYTRSPQRQYHALR